MEFKKDDSCTIQKSSYSLININTLNTFFISVLDKGYHLLYKSFLNLLENRNEVVITLVNTFLKYKIILNTYILTK